MPEIDENTPKLARISPKRGEKRLYLGVFGPKSGLK